MKQAADLHMLRMHWNADDNSELLVGCTVCRATIWLIPKDMPKIKFGSS